MVGQLLVRGMLAGIAAGLLTFGFARLVGEPQVAQAIAFEAQAGEHHHGDEAEHHHHDEAEPELVSRETQADLGLLTGVVAYGVSVGGLFSLVFAFAHGRVGRMSARTLSAWLAVGAFVSLVAVPTIKYPANPPSIGDPDTIGYRTALYFVLLAVSVAVTVFSVNMRSHLAKRFGNWNASILACGIFIALVTAVQLGFPAINEAPPDFPATLLWKFRLVAIGMQMIMWTVIGLLFGAWVEHSERRSREGEGRARVG
ncbi:CbtA family protein [Paraburkholderia dilworthii]|uniref:CbtA family protein n=1 Tax=Paraburkholderia dilworthii TaxID=948106 RepID=UPI0004093E0B|nr:CbtA family protein [Paraburkholderia dilworthii]